VFINPKFHQNRAIFESPFSKSQEKFKNTSLGVYLKQNKLIKQKIKKSTFLVLKEFVTSSNVENCI
jgi:hypothetical protein